MHATFALVNDLWAKIATWPLNSQLCIHVSHTRVLYTAEAFIIEQQLVLLLRTFKGSVVISGPLKSFWLILNVINAGLFIL